MFTTDHKRIALLIIATAFVVFFCMGGLALLMRAQLAQPAMHVLGKHAYNQVMTIHGSGMIFMAVTPFSLAIGVYLVPLQIGSPTLAAPRLAMAGFWLYLVGAVSLFSGFAVVGGAAATGWTAYTPLSDSQYSPSAGMNLWLAGVFAAELGMMLIAGCLLWTILFKRAPNVTLMRMPVFTWSMVATVLMVLAAFPSLLAAIGLIAVGRMDPTLFDNNVWNMAYQNMWWFFGHPVVYVMFFPFVGCVAEVLSTFAGRPFVGYHATVVSLLTFSALSMAVWGHHMFVTGQATDEYYSLISTLLAVPAGIEYFGMVGTLIGGRLHFPTAMHFALAFIPQFLIGGLTGIMVGQPVFDYHAYGSYFIVAHFHYTLLAGSVFGFFAGVYFWFPKVTGKFLDERLGRLHFWLMVVGTNVTFLPMFALGMLGMPRRVATYPNLPWWGTLNLISSIGAGIIGLSMLAFAWNLLWSLAGRRVAGDNPWLAHTLEWATSSPPPPLNFDAAHPIPKVTSFHPLLDLRLRAAQIEREPSPTP